MPVPNKEALLEEHLIFSKLSDAEQNRWKAANSILYSMCRDNPTHNDLDVIAGKVLLIGRTYAAAIERGADSELKGDDFYFEVVAPKLRGSQIDELLNDSSIDYNCANDSTLRKSLEIHRYLTDLFSEMTGKNNRSLASKYLHFHRQEAFFIYDSRAEKAASHWVKRPNRDILEGIDCDQVYGTFICRIRELRQCLEESPGAQSDRGSRLSPRDIDNFLLWSFNRIS